VGAGWGADPFSLVGGNPVSLVDPWGLSPVSVEDFEKYRESCADRGVNGWLNRNADAIQTALTVVGVVASVAGLIVAGPVALIVAGVVAGASLAAASSISSNRDENGRVNWGRVGIDAAIGGAFGAIGGGIAGQGRNMMVALGRTKAVGALEQAITGGWSKGAKVFATRASVHAIPEVAANFVGGFENLAHDAVNGKIGDKGQYSIREHVVSTVSGGIFGGLSNAAPRALAGSLAKKASPTLISTMEKTYQKTYDSALKAKNKITPYVQKINNEKITNAFDFTSEKVSNLIKKSKVDEPRPLIQRAFDTLTPAVLKTSQDLIDTWGKKGEIGLTDIIWSGTNGFKAGISGRNKYHEGSSVKDPRTIAQLGMSHDTSLSRITYVRNPEKNKALLEKKEKELDKIMLEVGRDNVVSKGKDELKDMASYIKDHREEVVNNSDKSFSELIVDYQNSKGEK
jgi:RHS-family protein